MSILINRDTKILVQGITGREGSFFAYQMMRYGSNVAAGVTPGKGGEWVLDGKIPVFDLVSTAVEMTGVNASVVFVPPMYAFDAVQEAANAGISLIICVTSGVPVQDVVRLKAYFSNRNVRFIGPSSPGVINPGESSLGVIPGSAVIPGNVGVVSRSGTLTFEILDCLRQKSIGVSTCVGIGSDPVFGTGFTDVLNMFESDIHTEKVVIIGEIGGDEEEKAAEFISRGMSKPVVAYVAGLTAPHGKCMGHAGAIVEGEYGNAANKISALKSAGVRVARYPGEIPALLMD
ncbi:MAG: succinate--CoA ligase subunit alpha [Bacteroidales bacterium]|nr:succinate--CoA ligase subunit alpha [Bacteroidales bacterium]